MARRKVAFLTPLYFDEGSCLGGGERYPTNLARGVADSSHGDYHVELISFGPAPRRQELRQGVSLRVLTAARTPSNPADVVSWELPGAVADADIVHIHQAYTRCSEMGLLVAKQQRKPICVTDHGGNSSPLGIELGSLELADVIFCQSDFIASMLRTRTPIVMVKGGVDATLFSPPAERPKRDRVLYVGRLLPHKGIDRLISALPPELPLTVCGRPYHEPYFQLLRSLAEGKQVEFVTDADDATIRRLYARAWANVLPSVYRDCYGHAHLAPELMGLTLLEAMACGTPAICSRVAAMPEFIRDGETGFVFDTPEDLAGQLRTLAADPARVEAMGRKAREVVEREYALDVVGAKTVAVYDELLRATREVAA